MPDLYVTTSAPAARLRADTARRTITGQVVPWGTFARVSTGQVVAFARGSLSLSERAKLVLDHDPARPVAVYVDSTDTEAGLDATFRVPAGPRGDDVLAEAADGLRDGFSVGADIGAFDEQDGGSIWVTAARGRHVALLSEPAFDTARVSAVVAAPPPPTVTPTTGAPPMPLTATATATPTEPEPPAEPEPEPEVYLTAAGAARPSARPAAPARTRDQYPYALPHHLGGPSFVRDLWKADEEPGSLEAARWRKAQDMSREPGFIAGALSRMSSAPPHLAAATGTTTTDPALVPPHWMPERYVPLLGPKAPLYTALTKYSTPDFTTLEVPRTATETGLAGVPADEVTPIAPGDIATTNDTVTISEVEGAYMFSRKLLLGSNPQIDRIALDAMERAWLAQVETEAVTYFVGGATVHTAVNATYADGPGYIKALRTQFAAMAAGTLYSPTVVIPASKEYQAAAGADDSTGRGLLPYGPMFNSQGESSPGYASMAVHGVPLQPGPYMTANHTLILDQSRSSAVIWATPVMDFRLEWVTDTATGGNVKVLKLVKWSGVGFWSQYPGGVVLMTNTTPIAAEADDGGNGGAQPAEGARKAAR
jgi:phage head maturation protease